jgi:hypothetical protein
MTQRYCEVCKTIFNGETETIEINDGREKIQISGHFKCVDELFIRMKKVKNYQNKSIDKILKEVNFKVQ